MREDTKKSRLLKDPNVKRWYHNLAAGSMHTADVAVRRLTRFCELGKVAHDTLLSLPQKELEDLAQDVVRECERVGYAPDYTMGLVRGLRSWLRHNERELKRDIKIKDLGVPVTLAEETVPEPFQLQEVLSAATTRGKVTASFMAFSGLRPEVLGNKDGTLGLVLGDLPDLDLEKLEFRSIPAQVVVRRELSKVRHQYFTFLNAKGCEYLLAYLRWRAREIRHDKTKKLIKPAEKLTPNSPVIRADEDHKKAMLEHQRLKGLEITPTDFLATTKIAKEVRRAIKRAGHKLRPYVLRSFFDSHLLNAELQGRMT